jgi:hypothetical protein
MSSGALPPLPSSGLAALLEGTDDKPANSVTADDDVRRADILIRAAARVAVAAFPAHSEQPQLLFCWWRFLLHQSAAVLQEDLGALLKATPGGRSSADLQTLQAASVLIAAGPDLTEYAAAQATATAAVELAAAESQSPRGWAAVRGTRSKVFALLLRAAVAWNLARLGNAGSNTSELEHAALADTKAAAGLDEAAKMFAGERFYGLSQSFSLHRAAEEFAGFLFPALRTPADESVDDECADFECAVLASAELDSTLCDVSVPQRFMNWLRDHAAATERPIEWTLDSPTKTVLPVASVTDMLNFISALRVAPAAAPSAQQKPRTHRR